MLLEDGGYEGLDRIELAGVDERHEEIPDLRAVGRLVEECVFPMKDRFLQSPLDKYCCQAARPVRAGTASTGSSASQVRIAWPRLELGSTRWSASCAVSHPWSPSAPGHCAFGDTRGAPLVRPLLARLGVVSIDGAQRLEDMATLGRKIRCDLHHVPPGVRHIWRSGYGAVSGAWNYPELMQQAAVNNR